MFCFSLRGDDLNRRIAKLGNLEVKLFLSSFLLLLTYSTNLARIAQLASVSFRILCD